jgi:hypothetical protein
LRATSAIPSSAAHHAYAAASKLFNWALAKDRGGEEANPCRMVKIGDPVAETITFIGPEHRAIA